MTGRWHERPAQLGDILDAAATSALFPVHQPDTVAGEDDVARLKIIVHDALDTGHHPSGEVVELANDPRERIEPERVRIPVVRRHARKPR